MDGQEVVGRLNAHDPLRLQPTVSGDAELPALSVTMRRKLFGRESSHGYRANVIAAHEDV
jgi:hypothetical protein